MKIIFTLIRAVCAFFLLGSTYMQITNNNWNVGGELLISQLLGVLLALYTGFVCLRATFENSSIFSSKGLWSNPFRKFDI